MGAYDNGRGGITLFSTHEVSTTAPLALKGKSNTSVWGTSITKMTISKNSRNVTSASNFIQGVSFYNYTTGKYQSTPAGAAPAGVAAGTFDWGISRFCSATYSPAGTFIYNGIGYEGGLFTAGEEVGDDSRGFAFDEDGNGFQLPRMGMTAFENIIPLLLSELKMVQQLIVSYMFTLARSNQQEQQLIKQALQMEIFTF
jgi:hypothetical protein